MSDLGAVRELESLLPWYLNGSLGPDERRRVEAALEQDPALRSRLIETAALGDAVLAARPENETLVAFAAGELAGEEQERVERWLAEDVEDSSLVDLLRQTLSSGDSELEAKSRVESSPPRQARSRPEPWRGWPALAAAASLLAAVAIGAWWMAREDLSMLRERGLLEPVNPIAVVELLPAETVRSGPSEIAPASLPAGPVAVVLVIDTADVWDRLLVEIRDADGEALHRREVAPPEDGAVSLLVDLDRLERPPSSLVLLGERESRLTELHTYRVELEH